MIHNGNFICLGEFQEIGEKDDEGQSKGVRFDDLEERNVFSNKNDERARHMSVHGLFGWVSTS